jgi:hypothetical protein
MVLSSCSTIRLPFAVHLSIGSQNMFTPLSKAGIVVLPGTSWLPLREANIPVRVNDNTLAMSSSNMQ